MEQLCAKSSACPICLSRTMCSTLDSFFHTQTRSLCNHIKSFVNFPKDKNKQPKCHHWPALYWLCGSFSASLCTHQLDWQNVWFTLNQSASMPEQTFGLIRRNLREIWCQRCAGTKTQLGTLWSVTI